MSIDLTGIQNENEFYSDHYLTTVFEGDIKDTISSWNTAKGNVTAAAPHEALARLATPFIRIATEYKDTRDPGERTAIFRRFAFDLLSALGYERRIELRVDADGTTVPVLSRIVRTDGTDAVWIVEVLAPAGEDFITDPLVLEIPGTFDLQDGLEPPPLRQGTYEDAVTSGIFGLDRPPRFVLLLSMSQAVLIDRNKWGESRLLRFDLTEIFTRRESGTLQAVAALLHRESLAPDGGTPLIDTIDEECHRHAHGVSKDLKYALREAIELLGNEAAEQIVLQRLASGKAAFQTRDGKAALDAKELSLECLRYMYRLLFLFYIESRPDLGFAPMKSEAYRKGYSLESLRTLELVPLTSGEEKTGHFINDSLNLLFRLVYEGTPNLAVKLSKDEGFGDFEMRPVRTHLFDPEVIPMLSDVRFQDGTLQRVIQLMSLSREGQGRRGRISYAQLGINQLGAVYESLLSYSGFFAQEDLYEVKKAEESNPDLLEAAYFAPRSEISNYEQSEIVYDGNQPRIFPKGSFIYRLSGRDRENSASYYTPEILTRCIVKYTLSELLKDKNADDILGITICEPTMGSAAFLVEAINQLAEAYLARKQEELGQRIPHEQYAFERQKVRAYITDRNAFGVDLNPIAMELGQVSLWLNCIHEGEFIPWFGDQLFAGNSLVGARREVYPITQISKGTNIEDRWHNRAPRTVRKNASRRTDEVYHFLLPDPAIADYKKSVVEPLAPDAFAALKEWRKAFAAPLEKDEVTQALRLSAVVDHLMEDNAKALAKERRENTDPISIWGQPPEQGQSTDYKEKNLRLARMRGEGARSAEPYQRLKTAMDYWCALWFWPIEHAAEAPSREQFFLDMTLILEGNFVASGADMFQRADLLEGADPNELDFFVQRKPYGQVDIATLKTKSPRIQIVDVVAQQTRFFHWSVELGDVLLASDGFDLILGNPPWIKPEWKDQHILAEYDPRVVLRDLSASQIEDAKPAILSNPRRLGDYTETYGLLEGLRLFLSANQNYLFTAGQPNIYKCLVCRSFDLTNDNGFIGLLHPEGHLVDPKGHDFRRLIYAHLLKHFQFRNQIQTHMFSDIPHREEYSVNVYRGKPGHIHFDTIHNLFLPKTIDECYAHDGAGEVPGIKSANGKWEVRGHSDRIVVVDDQVLSVFASIMEGVDTEATDATRMPSPHSKQVLRALEKIGANPDRFAQQVHGYRMDRLWDESTDTKISKLIKRETEFRDSVSSLIISGPNIYVANPLAKTPRRNCKSKGDFDSLYLLGLPDDYFPRANYTPNVDLKRYMNAIPTVGWSSEKQTEFYRLAFRRRVRAANERSLISAIIPPGIGHVNTIESVAFRDEKDLLIAAALYSSIFFDFVCKVAGVTDFRESLLRNFAWAKLPDTAIHRTLQLNCLTRWYSDLWNRHSSSLRVLPWTSDDQRLTREGPLHSTPSWTTKCGLRTDFARRLALLEIDVLVAIALGLTVQEIVQMYRVQFPVMQACDEDTWYDQEGKIVWTSSKQLNGVGLPDRKIWEAHKDMVEGSVSKTFIDDTMPGGAIERTITYYAPFTLPNREEDYERAWSFFYPKYASKTAA